MNLFEVVGSCLALWALLLSFLGITREGFPRPGAQERIVALISIVLVASAIGSAIYVGATENKGSESGSLFVLPV